MSNLRSGFEKRKIFIHLRSYLQMAVLKATAHRAVLQNTLWSCRLFAPWCVVCGVWCVACKYDNDAKE